jgi:hypothetical protein
MADRAPELPRLPAQRHPHGTYQEFFRRLDLEHQVSVRLPAGEPLMVVVNVNRSRCDCPRRDRMLMELMLPHLVQAYRNAEGVTELRHGLALLDPGVDGLGRGLVILGADRRAHGSPSSSRAGGARLVVRLVSEAGRSLLVLGVETRTAAARTLIAR